MILDPAARLISERVVVRPVYEAAEVVPFVNAAELNTIAQPDGYSSGQVDIVRDQECLSASEPNDEALMTRAVIVILEQAYDAARVLDPALRVGPAIALLNARFTLRLTAPS